MTSLSEGSEGRVLEIGTKLVVIVDDDEAVRRALGRLVRSEGWLVHTEASGEGLLELLSRSRPDCVVLDLQMPGVGGVDLIRRLRDADPPPVIVLSASRGEELTHAASELGAAGFFQKPVDVQALLDAIRWAMRCE